jgi:hypothetical protein
LHPHHLWWEPQNDRRGTLYEGLPYFIADMRPQGFLGRAFARRQTELQLPQRLADWSDDQALLALTSRGDDFIGNLILGENSLRRFMDASALPIPALTVEARAAGYEELAARALEGQPAGSSAGGEHPKFAAAVRTGNEARHVLVKFSPPLTTAVGRRWGDLLVCEALALEALKEAGVDAPDVEIVTTDSRVFLEVRRFDRIGERGRIGVVSLGAIDDYHFGKRDNYCAAARRLYEAKMISMEERDRMFWIQTFGTLIRNTDMHFGNVSFYMQENRIALAPVYDMLPMLYSPVNDQIIHRPFDVELPSVDAVGQWVSAKEAATRFWGRVANDGRISNGFRAMVARNAEMVEALSEKMRAYEPAARPARVRA